MPKRRMTPLRRIQIRKWQQAGLRARGLRTYPTVGMPVGKKRRSAINAIRNKTVQYSYTPLKSYPRITESTPTYQRKYLGRNY
jgi:hypothetical protein